MAKRGNPAWVKGVSGNPSGKRNDVADKADKADNTDAVVNALTGMGMLNRDKTTANNFVPDIVDAETGMLLWRGDPIGARIVETPPNEAIRQGYDICIGDDAIIPTYTPEKPAPPATAPPPQTGSRTPKTDWHNHPSAFERYFAGNQTKRRMDDATAQPLQEKITKHFQELKVNKLLKETWCYARAGGGGALLIGANDYTTDLRQPLDLTKVRSLDYLTPLEGRELVPVFWYNDPYAPKFGEVAIYQLVPYTIGAGVDGSYGARITQIHESRLLKFHGPKVTRRQLGSTNFQWGDSVFTRCARALMAWNASTQGASLLMSDFAQAVYKVQGLAELVSKNPQALVSKMVQTDMMRSIARAMIVDSSEDFERKATPMTGYPETMDRLAANVASAADQPLSLLFGQAPAGLNATGDSDIRFFYDRVASGQQEHLAPELCKLIEIELAIAGENPANTNFSIRFKPLWQPTELETAQARFQQAQTDQIYIANSVVSPEEIAVSRFGGDQFSFETHVDFDARAAQDAAAAPMVDAAPKPDPQFSTPTPAPESTEGVMPAEHRDYDPDQDRAPNGEFGSGGSHETPKPKINQSTRAAGATFYANELSKLANKTNTPEAHRDASAAHHDAAALHRAVGNAGKSAETHEKKAALHDKKRAALEKTK